MPKQQRYAIKQKLDTIVIELERAQGKIAEVAEPYEQEHPDYYNVFQQAGYGLMTVIQIIREISKEI